jgi:hypothetical protein
MSTPNPGHDPRRDARPGNGNGHGAAPREWRDYPARGHALDERELETQSIGTLLRQLGRDVPDLLIKELALARSEIAAAAQSTKTGVASLVTGAAILMPGVFVLLMAAVYGLALIMPLWGAALIVGGVVTLIGISMVLAGKKKLEAESLKPERALHQMQKDRDAIKGERA